MNKLEAPDVPMAKDFLSMIDPRAEKFTFQIMPDFKGSQQQKAPIILHGETSNDSLWNQLDKYNKMEMGIFVTVNETDFLGRKKSNIKRARALFFDQDSQDLPKLPIKPSILVKTKNGWHGYYLFNEEIELSHFSSLQKRLVKKLDTDAAVVDLPRLMRLPGFYHLKEPSNPFLVQTMSTNSNLYSLQDFYSAFPDTSNKKKSEATFNDWISSLPMHEGVRNNSVLKICREALSIGKSYSDTKAIVLNYSLKSGLKEDEALSILDRQFEAHKESPFKQIFTNNSEKGAIDYNLSIDFLRAKSSQLNISQTTLIYFSGTYYEFNGSQYNEVPEDKLCADVMRFLQKNPDLNKYSTIKHCREIVMNLRASTEILNRAEAPFWLDNSKEDPKRILCLENGNINLNQYCEGNVQIRPPTQNFFTLNPIKISFDPSAQCPKWEEFLAQVFGVPLTLELQKWFGLNLLPDTSYQKILFLFGEGSNGKSVICSVLRMLLGSQNCSSIGLEALSGDRTFPMASMNHKLANIVAEVSKHAHVSEHLIKQLTGTDIIGVEMKHKDPFDMRCSARFIVSANSLPKFTDPTDALWRRLLIFPMEKQFLDSSQQNRDLLENEYWKQELPGILLWAMNGYKALKSEGFIQSKQMTTTLIDYKEECNPIESFIKDCVTKSKGKFIQSSFLYEGYKEYLDKLGLRPLPCPEFNRRIEKTFKISRPALQTIDGKKARFWRGIDLETGTVRTDEY